MTKKKEPPPEPDEPLPIENIRRLTHVGRDAKTGQFIPANESQRRPKTKTIGTSKKADTDGQSPKSKKKK